MIKLDKDLRENDTQARFRDNGILHRLVGISDKVGQSAFELICPVEVPHAGEDAAMVVIDDVHPVGVGTKVVPLPTDVLAKPKTRVEAVQLPLLVVGAHSSGDVLFDPVPHELCQLSVIGHEAVVPPVTVHHAVLRRSVVAFPLAHVDDTTAFLFRQCVADYDSLIEECARCWAGNAVI